ncbi:hypothetical protein VARIO8X_90518 [Burkholderiales bacterium 8X]|nr:hypothetical protein VARIO8X_90518 [Burkholderiales bacterium 8X]
MPAGCASVKGSPRCWPGRKRRSPAGCMRRCDASLGPIAHAGPNGRTEERRAGIGHPARRSTIHAFGRACDSSCNSLCLLHPSKERYYYTHFWITYLITSFLKPDRQSTTLDYTLGKRFNMLRPSGVSSRTVASGCEKPVKVRTGRGMWARMWPARLRILTASMLAPPATATGSGSRARR